MGSKYIYKVATSDDEFEQIHGLNHDTFAMEIPQHRANADRLLVDKFHDENTYFICIKDKLLIGMLAARAKRPFSLDNKIERLDSILPPHRYPCEIRLLSIRRNYRASFVLYNLMGLLANFCRENQHDLLVISGTVRQLALYKHIGFIPFGNLVGTPEASYQPMYLKLDDSILNKFRYSSAGEDNSRQKACFLPGPVGMSQDVYKAIAAPAVSHRSVRFKELHADVSRILCNMVNAKKVELFVGTGTLANDVIAGQLSLLEGEGLILSNGEFGERLIDHAQRFNLKHVPLRIKAGDEFNLPMIKLMIMEKPSLRWIWFVHCETSTGILNDLEGLKAISKDHNLSLCVDCISSIGATEVDLRDVYLASCVSGKCLGSFPGLSMVFYNHKLANSEKKLPRYLDLEFYSSRNGIPFTGSSNMLNALYNAIQNLDLEKAIKERSASSAILWNGLENMGLKPVGSGKNVIPSVITLQLPVCLPSNTVAEEMEKNDIYISYNTDYLKSANRIQICLMGQIPCNSISKLLGILRCLLSGLVCNNTSAEELTL